MKRVVSFIFLSVLLVVMSACSSSNYDTVEYGSGSSFRGDSVDSAAAPRNSMSKSSNSGYGVMQESADYGSSHEYVESAVPQMENDFLDISVTDPSRKLIRTANLTVETTTFEDSLVELEQLCLGMQGYVASSNITGNSITNRHYQQMRGASYVFRIPSSSYNAFLNAVGSIGNVINRHQNSQDVTYEYTDIESRVRMLRMRQERLEGLLARETDSIAVINYENSLTDTLYEIERLSGNLRRYDSLVDYSTIEVRLSEVREYTEVEPFKPAPESVWERIKESFERSLDDLGYFFTDLFVWFAGNILYILLWGIAIVTAFLAIRRVRKKAGKVLVRRERPRKDVIDLREPADSTEDKREDE